MLGTPGVLSGSTLSLPGQLTCVIFCILHILCLSLQERTVTVRSFPLLRYYDLCWLLNAQPCITARVGFFFQSVPLRPPRISALTFIPYICRIYISRFGQYWTLLCVASSSALILPYMRFLFVRPGFCYCLLSDSTSRWTPLTFANSSYWQACIDLSSTSQCACRAYNTKPRRSVMDRQGLFDQSLSHRGNI